ncbi:hypothetical protein VNO77_18953 [Canavalia gladiata]|uniref:Uncharacterized protein n=1 Tax=Canavalia gladiata TaxID=3824 RepID=A0AAN9QKW8_CANGL
MHLPSISFFKVGPASFLAICRRHLMLLSLNSPHPLKACAWLAWLRVVSRMWLFWTSREALRLSLAGNYSPTLLSLLCNDTNFLMIADALLRPFDRASHPHCLGNGIGLATSNPAYDSKNEVTEVIKSGCGKLQSAGTSLTGSLILQNHAHIYTLIHWCIGSEALPGSSTVSGPSKEGENKIGLPYHWIISVWHQLAFKAFSLELLQEVLLLGVPKTLRHMRGELGLGSCLKRIAKAWRDHGRLTNLTQDSSEDLA